MYELVETKGDEIFTTSKIIAEGTNNKHHSITAIIQKYESEFTGKVRFKIEPLPSGQKEKVYVLNEEQATFLMTLLRNSKIVVKFKAELVRQFFTMKEYIREHHSQLYIETRNENKENRLKETDVIKLLVEYAKEQGSTHSDKLYMTYTKLAKSVIDGKRDDLSITELNTLTLVESIILRVIRDDMSMEVHYKDIYKDCKYRIEQFKEIVYLQEKN